MEGIRIIENALKIILPIETAAKFSVADKAHTGIRMSDEAPPVHHVNLRKSVDIHGKNK